MPTPHPRAAPAPGGHVLAGAELLERAVAFTRGALQLVPGTDLHAPTPCPGWDLHALLRHMNDALAAFTEAAEIGYVDLVPVRDEDPGLVIVERLRSRACALVAVWSEHDVQNADPGIIGVSRSHTRPELRSDLLAAAGALEITTHGWDVYRACGVDRPVPAALALELLDVVPVFVTDADRPQRFAERVDVPVHSRPSTKLLAALGRDARPCPATGPFPRNC